MPRTKKQQDDDKPKTKAPYTKLTDYIKKLYYEENQKPNWKLIAGQIQDIKKKYNITDTKIRYILMYMVEIRQMNLFANLEQGSVLNLVPYYIEEEEYLLTDYIKKLYDREKQEPNWILIISQIKNIKKKYNITGTQIQDVLMYMIDIRQKNLFDNLEQGSILNLVPYYIEETDEYLQFQKDIVDSAEKAETEEHNVVVNVNRHKLKSHKYISDDNLNFD